MGVNLKRASHAMLFLLVLPGGSVLISWLFSHVVVAVVPEGWTFLVDSVGVLGAYGLLFALFDRWLWRAKVFRLIGVVSVPDLSGRWIGDVRSSHDGSTAREAALEVRQAFSEVSVAMYFPESCSASIIAGFAREPNGTFALHYEYQNVPMVDSGASMHIHFGTTKLECVPDQARVHGSYYNWGRDGRGHVGTMSFTFHGARLFHRLKQ